MDRAAAYIEAQGGPTGLRRRYGKDKTFAAPILTNCALAGLVRWRDVPALPFELACLPFPMLRFLRLPVVSYAVPALVAVGQARFFHRRPWNPLLWLLRRLCVGASLRAVERMQPPSGGFLEAAPLTSFVVMGLASTGRVDHAVVRRGVAFLLSTVREDGSWPIDVSLASWNTSLAIAALAAAASDLGALDCVGWLLRSQWAEVHPFTQAPPGGWGWNDAAGAAPDADDTAAALLALRAIVGSAAESQREPIEAAAAGGVAWLLDLQNDDGGWPTFCRGWGTMPFDRSGCDLTAHALRALHAWKTLDRRPRGRGDPSRAGLLGRPTAARRELDPALVRQSIFSQRGEPGLRNRANAAGVPRPRPDGDAARPPRGGMAGDAHRSGRGLGRGTRRGSQRRRAGRAERRGDVAGHRGPFGGPG